MKGKINILLALLVSVTSCQNKLPELAVQRSVLFSTSDIREIIKVPAGCQVYSYHFSILSRGVHKNVGQMGTAVTENELSQVRSKDKNSELFLHLSLDCGEQKNEDYRILLK